MASESRGTTRAAQASFNFFPAFSSIQGAATMQFRWNFYEYSRGKLRPLLPGAKWTWTDFSHQTLSPDSPSVCRSTSDVEDGCVFALKRVSKRTRRKFKSVKCGAIKWTRPTSEKKMIKLCPFKFYCTRHRLFKLMCWNIWNLRMTTITNYWGGYCVEKLGCPSWVYSSDDSVANCTHLPTVSVKCSDRSDCMTRTCILLLPHVILDNH